MLTNTIVGGVGAGVLTQGQPAATLGGSAQKQGAVIRHGQMMAKGLEVAHQRLSDLENRLTAVLTPSPPIAGRDEAGDRQIMSPIAQEQAAQIVALTLLIDRLGVLIDRVDL